ncbi:MAG TPA: FAD-dependent monooxygenase [Stellaceae bacterium]|jgi:2-polyprenyl-6-methoxyphenol hydroxylase-like FAD-dependent oxidoreductase
MSADVIPVLIAGGGPVGLALAIELGMAGIPCTVVEKRDGSISIPKMSGLSIRSMEFNRRWGIAEVVQNSGWPKTHPQGLIYCTSMVGFELARHHVPAYVDQKLPYTPEPRVACAQIFYDPILLAKARSLPSVTIRHLTSLESFAQDADGVTATVTDRKTGRVETLRARYLIGCDGADGTVVTALGFGYEGLGLVANSVNVFFRSAEMMKIHDKGWSRFFRFTDAGGTWGEIIGIDGKELWRLSVLKADPAFDGDRYLRRLLGRADVPYEILSVMAWERRERVAQHYRDRRVFICGDAAHQNSPTGGLGLHTGLADAVDLAWKLIGTLRGWGGPGLLDAYEAERKPIALLNVHASTDEFVLLADLPGGPEIAEDSPAGAALRKRWAEAYRAANGARGPTFTENLRLGYYYEPSPICVPDGTPPIPYETEEFVSSARSGTRAPHAWLGEKRSILDLFGNNRFMLLRLGADPPEAGRLADAAATRGIPFAIVDLPDPKLIELYQRQLVLVRPDGHVAWRDDALPGDPLALIDRVRGAGH